MKENIKVFIEGLIQFDYILFGSSFVLFILLIILAILLRRTVALSLFIALLSFSTLFLAPTLGYIKMHEYLFKNNTQLLSQQKLIFTEAVVVKGTLSNESKFNFKVCKITASIYKVTGNKVKDLIFPFNPFQKMLIEEADIKIGETRDFKMIIEPFTYANDYNVSVKADCK